ncbi:MAG: hypothetical protein KGH60_00575 [Candidatus Micrarchaeota archaeon]|nr:hypothetical protein [Candidatus Micrarchaeota archaeon]
MPLNSRNSLKLRESSRYESVLPRIDVAISLLRSLDDDPVRNTLALNLSITARMNLSHPATSCTSSKKNQRRPLRFSG